MENIYILSPALFKDFLVVQRAMYDLAPTYFSLVSLPCRFALALSVWSSFFFFNYLFI